MSLRVSIRKLISLILFVIFLHIITSSSIRKTIKSYYYDIYFRYLPLDNHKRDICKSLQSKIYSILYPYSDDWSVTLLGENGSLLVDINSNIERIPASNQKLFTTAYALDKLGPYHKIKTTLYKIGSNTFELIGGGDPDLSTSSLNRFAKLISSHSDSSKPVSITLYEINKDLWWPTSWNREDRKESYGAPITRLALSSNANEYAILNPLLEFKQRLYSKLYTENLSVSITTKAQKSYKTNLGRTLIHQERSAPLYNLLSLANSESHNFTSEILLRTPGDTWDTITSSYALEKWINKKGLHSTNIQIRDGSGLSRDNRVTTSLITKLLYRMSFHRFFTYYLSSLSIPNTRGTLKPYRFELSNDYIFLGKTGTLDKVRALSGYLYSPKKIKFISVIVNGTNNVEYEWPRILSSVAKESTCNLSS